MKAPIVFGVALMALAVFADVAATNTFEAACCRAIDAAAAVDSWRWQYGGALEKDDVVFQNEIREMLAVKFPNEYAEALSCAGNTHNPKMRGLNAVLSTAIRQTATWRRIEDYSASRGYGTCFFPEGLEKLMLVKNADGSRTFQSCVWARGRTTDVTIPLRAMLRKFRTRNRPAAVSAQEMSEYRHDDGYKFAAPLLLMRGEERNGSLAFHCSYEPLASVSLDASRQVRTRELGRMRTFAEFDCERSWRLLARRPETYTSEDVLKVLGRPKRSVLLRLCEVRATDRRWEYEISDADDAGNALRHTLAFSFSDDGRCRRWTWHAE